MATATTPRGSYRNGLRTREQIIAKATTAFAERGFHGSSLRQIAADVGITPAAILRHFDSKDDLLAAVLESWAEQTADTQGSDHYRGIDYWTSQHQVFEYHLQHPGLLRLFLMLAVEATGDDHPARRFMAPRYRTTVEDFTKSLLDAAALGQIHPLSDADARSEARAIMSFMDGIEIQWFLDPTVDLVGEFDDHLAKTLHRLGLNEEA